MELLSSFLRAVVAFAAGDMVQRALWGSAALAAMLAVGGLTRHHRFSIRTIGIIVIATALLAQPALANFTASDAPVSPFAAANIAAPTGLSCSWTSGTSVSLSWTVTATAWPDNNYVNRSANGGSSYTNDVGNTGSRTTVTYTDTGLTPEANSYRWTVDASKNNWRGDVSSALAATSCSGGPVVSTPVSTPATVGQVNDPDGIWVDQPTGDVYIADVTNHSIRKVTASTGNISTVAGTTGTSGAASENVSATGATGRLNSPEAVSVASNGDIYIADTNNNKIRKVTASTGNISTVAGTGTAGFSGDGAAATAAKLDHPGGVLVTSDSTTVYVSDRANNRLRKFTVGGNISTLLGSNAGGDVDNGTTGACDTPANCLIQTPEGLAFDSTAANVYIADRANHKIKKYNIANRTLATVAGSGSSGNTGDGAAATSAKLNNPESVAVTSGGDFYIGDRDNKKIRKVTLSDGFISTYVGTGSVGFSGEGYPRAQSLLNLPHGVAVDSSDVLYFADGSNDEVRKVTATRGLVIAVAGTGTGGTTDNTTAASNGLVKPQGMAVDTHTSPWSVVIADPGDHRIRRWWSDTPNELETIAGIGLTGTTGDNGNATSARVAAPEGVAVDSSGDVYIADTGNHRIRKIDTASPAQITAYAGSGTACGGASCDNTTGTSAKFKSPSDLVVDSSGNIFVADTGDNAIRKIATGGSNGVTIVAGSLAAAGGTGDGGNAGFATLDGPDGIGIDSSNNLYVADTNNNRIRKIDTQATPQITKIAGTAGQNTSCTGTASTGVTLSAPGDVVAVNSDLYVADTGHHVICRISGGTSSLYMGTSGSSGTSGDAGAPGSALLNAPNAIAFGSTAGLFVAHNVTGGRVRKVSVPLFVS